MIKYTIVLVVVFAFGSAHANDCEAENICFYRNQSATCGSGAQCYGINSNLACDSGASCTNIGRGSATCSISARKCINYQVVPLGKCKWAAGKRLVCNF